ncbi:putative manganese-dependent inorganic diphosphatase [Anaerovorax odorimutans]|uniref:putative manganese-dependent inorganic diphosphatase n=1 Tax=Anaerovorax odorimutans TaxID=109327 RepID=UPI00041C8607|nr:putative manganese-dependent inorganic diphosphatase [Anaerovorax odorimutans]
MNVLLQKKNILVIGHKNPDTDSICSAIAYANLKNKISDDVYIAKRAGKINEETQYVLKQFEIEIPEYIEDVGTQIKDIEIRNLDGVSKEISLKKAWHLMREKNVVTLPIITNDNYLEGLITIKDLVTSYMDVYDNRILSKAETPYKNILETLDGTLVVGDESGYFDKGKIVIATSNPDLMEGFIEENDIVLLGNRYESQFCAIEMKASVLVVCANHPISATIKKLASERGCVMISTPHDTFTAARLINQSTPIDYFMRRSGLVTFQRDDYMEDIKIVMGKKRYRDFPVLDENGKYCGMISRRYLLDMDHKKVILVDHNEKSQAVDGLEEAEILEIIDHHRLGNLETINPVFFRNQPLGCTATIIYQMYQENCIEIDKKTAGLLCAAIISDTLMYRSPTCTPMDINAAEELAKRAGIDVDNFAKEMFQAGSSLKEKTIEEVFNQDFKTFKVNDMTFGVGQINSMNENELADIKERLTPYIKESCIEQKQDMQLFMLTNIIEETTQLIYTGLQAKEIISMAFPLAEELENIYLLKGVVSRKKQLIPALISAIQRLQ